MQEIDLPVTDGDASATNHGARCIINSIHVGAM